MRCEIISVGTEILLGDIINSDAQYLSKKLSDMGIECYYQTVVGDNPERLKEAYDLAFKRSDLVITTGGLGPTEDDLTKEVAFEFLGKKSEVHEESLERIKDYFKRIGREMVKSNEKQAHFPKDAIVLKNNVGTAPGCILEEGNKIIINLPGPPKEMQPMFEDYVVPYLSKFQNGILVSEVLRVIGIGESTAAELVSELIEKQTNPTIAPYAKDGEVIFRITAKAKSREEGIAIIRPVKNRVKEILKENVYGEGNTSIEEVVAKMLVDNDLTIATAESCTGGMIASKLINYPGISSVFLEGAVTYSNESKIDRLGVRKSTLESCGAVSQETAEEMVIGIVSNLGAKVGLSTTGIAGPGGGTKEKPVGLVYIAIYIEGDVVIKKLNLIGSRQDIRERTTRTILDLLRRELLKKGFK